MRKARTRSILHLQLGQEVIYLLLTTFAVTSLILALLLLLKTPNQNEQAQQQSLLAQLRSENDKLRADRDKALADVKLAEAEISQLKIQLNDKPPIINLKEGDGYSFPLGEATLTEAFRDKLTREAVPMLLRNARKYGATVIEVIGHTDELPISGRSSNLDGQLVPFLHSTARGQAGMLSVADNAGLGMARAAAVAQYLMTEPQLFNLRVLPLSGAQVINTDDALSKGEAPREAAARRRIEIRLRRAN